MILTDSGFWIALGNRGDRHHEAALRALAMYAPQGFVTTWPVLTEVGHILLTRVGIHQMVAFQRSVADGACRVFELPDDAVRRSADLMSRYRNLPMDVADASLLVLAEELDEGRILSTDMRDFEGYRWKNRRPFENLLLRDA